MHVDARCGANSHATPARPRTIVIIKRRNLKTIVIPIENSAAPVLVKHRNA